MDFPADWLVPQWPVPARVHALMTTRSGGVSKAPFNSFNLGGHVRDDPGHVEENRRILARATGARPVFLQQVHGATVHRLDASSEDGTVADACVTTQRGLVCTVMVADCLPVLWCHGKAGIVAASHAGWRGLVGEGGRGVLETTLDALKAAAAERRVGADAEEDIQVWLGPCIGPTAFEVGAEVRAAFVASAADTSDCFVPGPAAGKFLADLPELARRRLRGMGISGISGNDGSAGWCTVTQSSRFFSHRRDAVRLGSTGRMGACIWLD